jgi:hypothetical protein
MSVPSRFRRVGALVAVGAALAVVAAPAEASGTHFKVVGVTIGGHETANGFTVREALFNPLNPGNRVGNLKAKCKQRGKIRCLGRFHFDGSIGGFGDLWVRGNFGAHDTTGNVVDGTGTFTGAVAGKVNLDPIDRHTTLYGFHLVD